MMTREEKNAMKAGDTVWQVTPRSSKPRRRRLLRNVATWMFATIHSVPVPLFK